MRLGAIICMAIFVAAFLCDLHYHFQCGYSELPLGLPLSALAIFIIPCLILASSIALWRKWYYCDLKERKFDLILLACMVLIFGVRAASYREVNCYLEGFGIARKVHSRIPLDQLREWAEGLLEQNTQDLQLGIARLPGRLKEPANAYSVGLKEFDPGGKAIQVIYYDTLRYHGFIVGHKNLVIESHSDFHVQRWGAGFYTFQSR